MFIKNNLICCPWADKKQTLRGDLLNFRTVVIKGAFGYFCARLSKSKSLLRFPKSLFRLGAPSDFDHCAILASLHPPPAALQRRCPHGEWKRNCLLVKTENKEPTTYITRKPPQTFSNNKVDMLPVGNSIYRFATRYICLRQTRLCSWRSKNEMHPTVHKKTQSLQQ